MSSFIQGMVFPAENGCPPPLDNHAHTTPHTPHDGKDRPTPALHVPPVEACPRKPCVRTRPLGEVGRSAVQVARQIADLTNTHDAVQFVRLDVDGVPVERYLTQFQVSASHPD